MAKKSSETKMSISTDGGATWTPPVPASSIIDGYENTGHTETYPAKFTLTEPELLRYGQLYAKNLRVAMPEIRYKSRDAIAPLEERLDQLCADRDDLVSELAPVPEEETNYINSEPNPEHARELARILEEIRGTEAQIGMLKTEAKIATAKLELENELIALRLNLGYEMKDVTCAWWVNWGDGMKRLVRIDTGEVVLRKPLSPEERQMNLLDLEITDEVRAGIDGEEE